MFYSCRVPVRPGSVFAYLIMLASALIAMKKSRTTVIHAAGIPSVVMLVSSTRAVAELSVLRDKEEEQGAMLELSLIHI